MKKINFVKYNKTRREAFQIRTSLVEEEGCPFVEKTALRRKAKSLRLPGFP